MSEASDHNLRHEDYQYFTIPWQGDLSLADMGLTIVHPFYNEKERFDIQWERWKKWSPLLKEKVEVILADDHSDPPVDTYLPSTPDINLKIYRVLDDLKFNTPGCLNLGISQAQTEWVLIMDSDCLLEPISLEWLLNLQPDHGFCYRFHRNRVTKNPKHRKHRILGCSILFSKDQWKDVGGFDEDFTGEYSGGYGYFDNDFNRKLALAGYRKGVPVGLHVTEYLDDMFQRKNIQILEGVRVDKEHLINKKLSYEKAKAKFIGDLKDTLRFKWERRL